MDAVVLKNLTRTFGGSVQAVTDISLECREGEFLCFLGPSGCGKSTTLRMIAGLESVSSGDILIKGRRVNDVPSRDRRIAMVFENYALYKFLTVFENVAFPLRIRKLAEADIGRKVREVAALLAIDDILEVRADSLSGGQQQRVGIARALVRDADVLLMDEPISHLEARLRANTRRELKHLQGSLGIATVYVTHDQLEAMALGDRIAVIHQGRLQQIGPPDEILNRPRNMFVAGFIGEPPINFIEVDVVRENGDLGLRARDVNLTLPARDAAAFTAARMPVAGSARVVMGARPFDIELSRDLDAGAGLFGVLSDWSPLYDSAIARVTVGGAEVLALTSMEFAGEVGERVRLVPDTQTINLFDPATTLNLLAA
jgi:ABC-type sugar transport system ATPase subunit